jgi:hypothetical protein
MPYNGHIVWLGPQRKWWSDQRVHGRRRQRRAIWPPDPFLVRAAFEISSQTSSRIVMVGPESPVSGVQLTKSISVAPDGVVTFRASARNTRRRPVAWDLWFNTRLDGYSRCYVPVAGHRNVSMSVSPRPRIGVMPWQLRDGYFTFAPVAPSAEQKSRSAKAYLYPTAGRIAAFRSRQLLVLQFPRHPRGSIHPSQGLVEVFNSTTHRRGGALLELEYHAPFVTLEPGESMHATQRWELHPYDGGSNGEEQFRFLSKALR